MMTDRENGTGELLAQLEKYNAHATFFMQGKNIPGKEDFVKKMKETGCELGNHSYDHPQLTKLSADKIANQIGLALRRRRGRWP